MYMLSRFSITPIAGGLSPASPAKGSSAIQIPGEKYADSFFGFRGG